MPCRGGLELTDRVEIGPRGLLGQLLEFALLVDQVDPVRNRVEGAHADDFALVLLAVDVDDGRREAGHLAEFGHLLMKDEPQLLE